MSVAQAQPTVIPGGMDLLSKEKLARLFAEDAEFRTAAPDADVGQRKNDPKLRLAQVMSTVMEGYADRPALGVRARELVTEPSSGRRSLRLLPRFEMMSFGTLWANTRGLAADWWGDERFPMRSGDFACVLGFASPDYAASLMASIFIGAVNVPLQTSAPAPQHAAIMAETEPKVIAASITYIADAVDSILLGYAPPRMVVFDYDDRDDDQRDALAAARARLEAGGKATVVELFADVVGRGQGRPAAPLHVPGDDQDPLAWLFYTSGTTGTPKGVMMTERMMMSTWIYQSDKPMITLSFMPMSHLVGYGYLFMPLVNGGISYCSPKADLSTLFEDLALARPTASSLVPRVCEMLYQHFLREVDKRIAGGEAQGSAEAAVKTAIREEVLGGRLLSVGCGSAALAPEIYAFMEDMLGMHMAIGYSCSEMVGSTVYIDGKVQRPPVIDYRLVDVPELGYFTTDKPHPRGELWVKSAKFMAGYYKQPQLTADKLSEDGYYKTGDVMAELGPDHLVYVDRCNNVTKLSQGEFVAIARLEALYTQAPAIRQIYVYGTSERSYLLAVVVPAEQLLTRMVPDSAELKAEIRKALNHVAETHGLNGYEIPRDFLIDTEPFSLENGLLTGIGKFSRPNFRARFGPRLEARYAEIAQEQIDELRALRIGGKDRPVMETVTQAVQATLGISGADVRLEARFGDLGGDSLSALELSTLLEEIFGVEVPVGVIINPAGDLRLIGDYVEAQRSGGGKRASFSSVHDAESSTVLASDLKLDKFIDAGLLATAPSLPRVGAEVKTVLMTGSTGYLGRFQALSWLERLAKTGGKLILLSRGASAAQARQRLEDALDTDAELMAHFRALAADHLEVIPGDLGLPNLGLDDATWQRLAETVDLIVHPGAHVNHVLPYNQLFTANVAGTAELIKLAISSRIKRFHYVSTLGVSIFAPGRVDEEGDIRTIVPSADLDDGYANGYNVSKWASEVLMREAHALCGMPVGVYRPGMILAHSRYKGQLNVPDMFTRMIYSLAVTGVAPGTFYAEDLSGGRPKAHYEGFAVDFLADAITGIGAADIDGFHSYNLSSPYRDAIGWDEFVDWMIEAGCPIERVDSYADWLLRFETAMHGMSEEQKAHSMLAIMGPYRQPQHPGQGEGLRCERFCARADAAGHPVPHLTAGLIHKYVADLRHLGLLG